MTKTEPLYSTIGRRIKKLRENSKMTQLELSQKMNDKIGGRNIGRTSITMIEAGKQRITIHQLYKVSVIFEVPIRIFFDHLNDK